MTDSRDFPIRDESEIRRKALILRRFNPMPTKAQITIGDKTANLSGFSVSPIREPASCHPSWSRSCVTAPTGYTVTVAGEYRAAISAALNSSEPFSVTLASQRPKNPRAIAHHESRRRNPLESRRARRRARGRIIELRRDVVVSEIRAKMVGLEPAGNGSYAMELVADTGAQCGVI